MENRNNVLYNLEAEFKLSRNCLIDNIKKMKKIFFVMAITLLCSTSSFAECRSLSLGFVTIISGTTFQDNWEWRDNGTTFVLVNNPIEVPCSAGNRWQWFWE